MRKDGIDGQFCFFSLSPARSEMGAGGAAFGVSKSGMLVLSFPLLFFFFCSSFLVFFALFGSSSSFPHSFGFSVGVRPSSVRRAFTSEEEGGPFG